MTEVLVLYHSGMGHTAKMAEAVHEGAASVQGCNSTIMAIEGKDIRDGRYSNDSVFSAIDKADAVILGSPTYMGCVSANTKAFMEATSSKYADRSWSDKIASGFTVSGGPSGDKLNTLQTMVVWAMQLGMIWVGLGMTPFNDEGLNRLSFYIGAGGQALQEPPDEKPDEADLNTGSALGERVANLTLRFNKD